MTEQTKLNVQLFYDNASVKPYVVKDGQGRGLRHRTVIDYRTGAETLALWVEEHEPGFCVPLHRHNCEEIIAVIRGSIEAKIERQTLEVKENQSILIPEWIAHGFTVTSNCPVRLHAFFSSADPRNFDMDGNEYPLPWEVGN